MVTMVCILVLLSVCFYFSIKGTSHRAAIPSTFNWQFKIQPSSSLYTLNASSGQMFVMKVVVFNLVKFLGTFIETLENNEVRIERRLFASQEYTELLVAHVVLKRLKSTGQILTIDYFI
jgi:hypothetical protein